MCAKIGLSVNGFVFNYSTFYLCFEFINKYILNIEKNIKFR